MTLSLPLYAQDQGYPPWMMRRQLASMMSSGVGPNEDLVVTTTGSGIQVNIAAGDAYVAQSVESTEPSSADIGNYYIYNDAPINPTGTVNAPITNPRVDALVLRIYDVVEQVLSGSSRGQVEWVPGSETAGANVTRGSGGYLAGAPVSFPANSLVLAYVLQTVGETSIAGGNILNVVQIARPISDLSPVVVTGTANAKPGQAVYCEGTGSYTVNLPGLAYGSKVSITNLIGSGGTVTVAGTNINGKGLALFTTQLLLGTYGSTVTLLCDGSGWAIIAGEQDTGWIAPTLSGSWTNIGAGSMPAGYRKVADKVSLRGAVTGGTGQVFLLPTGFRPPFTVSYASPNVSVFTTGEVDLTGSNYLNGLDFSTLA